MGLISLAPWKQTKQRRKNVDPITISPDYILLQDILLYSISFDTPINYTQTVIQAELFECHFKHLSAFTNSTTTAASNHESPGLLDASKSPEDFQGR